MKICSIGDIHGHQKWKEVDPEKYDKIVFVGDYVDSFSVTDTDMLANFMDIIEFKKKYADKVVLLLGNHDIQYLFHPEYRCSGFRVTLFPSLTALYKENRSLFQAAYQHENYIWTHAGISIPWFNSHAERLKLVEEETLADRLNEILNTSANFILHEVGAIRGGGRYDHGGITWADRSETRDNYIKGYHQIVGHTPIREIQTFGDVYSSITYIDCLGKSGQFYELEV